MYHFDCERWLSLEIYVDLRYLLLVRGFVFWKAKSFRQRIWLHKHYVTGKLATSLIGLRTFLSFKSKSNDGDGLRSSDPKGSLSH